MVDSIKGIYSMHRGLKVRKDMFEEIVTLVFKQFRVIWWTFLSLLDRPRIYIFSLRWMSRKQ